jgi:hypothetical protein
VLVGLVLGLTAGVLAESDDQVGSIGVSEAPDPGGRPDVEIGTAIQALRGRVVGQSGDLLELQTPSRQVLVHPPAGFSAPLGACIQVVGQVPLGPVFEADQASPAPPEACPS